MKQLPSIPHLCDISFHLWLLFELWCSKIFIAFPILNNIHRFGLKFVTSAFARCSVSRAKWKNVLLFRFSFLNFNNTFCKKKKLNISIESFYFANFVFAFISTRWDGQWSYIFKFKAWKHLYMVSGKKNKAKHYRWKWRSKIKWIQGLEELDMDT